MPLDPISVLTRWPERSRVDQGGNGMETADLLESCLIPHQTIRKPVGCQTDAVVQEKCQRERRLKNNRPHKSTRVSSSSESQPLGLLSGSAEGDR